MKVARIFEDVGGYHICDDSLSYLRMSDYPLQTKAEALRSAFYNGYSYAIGSGTYWGNKVRKIPRKFHSF